MNIEQKEEMIRDLKESKIIADKIIKNIFSNPQNCIGMTLQSYYFLESNLAQQIFILKRLKRNV
ncbi:hypothetical protein [Sedimentibacter sp.]|uniref:hypothetical protein n=1 Tax=Sedimentibacter sp. TaxID=1960295 RepID=UPI0028A678A7|nr:hypothetical protein [Sedimentibacter sp.]